MAQAAARRGVVGLVDLDMAWNEDAWARRLAAGFDILRVEFGIYPHHLDRAIVEGLRSGDPVRGASSDLVHVGPLKVITDGSLGTRTAACSHAYPGDPHNHGLLTVDPGHARRAHDARDRRGARVGHPRDRRRRATTYALDAFAIDRRVGHDRARAARRARRHPAIRPARGRRVACSRSTRSTTAT